MAQAVKRKIAIGIGISVLALVLTAILVFTVICVIEFSQMKVTPPEAKTRSTELLQLQISKEQVESSHIEGNMSGDLLGTVGYVQGNSNGKPEMYVYIRYRAENGGIVDRLIPRNEVRLRDDLEPHTAATVELELSIHSDETKRESKDNNQQHLDAETPLVIHVPKGAVISTINPNMVPDTAQKQ